MRPTQREPNTPIETAVLKRTQPSPSQPNKRSKNEQAKLDDTPTALTPPPPSFESARGETICTRTPLLIINSRRKAPADSQFPVFSRSGTEADGNCFFHAVVKLLNHYKINTHKYDYTTLRAAVVEYIRENPEQFKVFITGIGYKFEQYLTLMSHNKEYADEIILQATVEKLEINIRVIYGKGRHHDGREATCEMIDHPPKNGRYSATIHLVYECCNPLNPNSWHYDSIIPQMVPPAKTLVPTKAIPF